MKKLLLAVLLVTPTISVATTQNLDPFPDCWPCSKPAPGGGDQVTPDIEALTAVSR